MQDRDSIDDLKSEIARLKSDLAKLNGMCKADSEDTTDHIKYIYKYLKLLDDRSVQDIKIHVDDFKLLVEYLVVLQDSVFPLEEKIFPGVSKARQQLAAIVENLKLAEHRKDDKRA